MRRLNTAMVLLVGFAAGAGFACLSGAVAARNEAKVDVTHKILAVSLAEVRQSFVFAEEFAGAYKTTLQLSDGSTRTVELTPMVHNGMDVVQINDSGHVSYTALDGMVQNGALMIQLRDVGDMHRRMCEQGWRFPSCKEP